METIELQLSSSASLKIETNIELIKVAHLGPVLCTSNASSTKATVKIGTQKIEGSLSSEKLKAELNASLISGFGANINAENIKNIEKRLIKSQESIVENSWELPSMRCKKISHEIFQRIEVTTYTITKRRFLSDLQSTYKSRIALPDFDIKQICVRYKDPACDDCEGFESNTLDRHVFRATFSDKYEDLPFKFYIVGNTESRGCVTFSARIYLLCRTYGHSAEMLIMIPTLAFAFSLKIPVEWGLKFKNNHDRREANKYLLKKFSGLSVEEFEKKELECHIPITQIMETKPILNTVGNYDGVDYNFLRSLVWAEDHSEEERSIAIDSDSGVVLYIDYSLLTQNLSTSQRNFISNVVGFDDRVTCGLILNNSPSSAPTEITASPNSSRRRDGGVSVG